MDASIDLTENRLFSDSMERAKNNTIHKNLPWKASNDDYVPLVPYNQREYSKEFFSFNMSLNSEITFNATSNYSFNFDDTSHFSVSSFHDDYLVSTLSYGVSDYFIVGINDEYIDEPRINKKNLDFPLGKRDDIREKHKKKFELLNTKNDNDKYFCCDECKQIKRKSPWNGKSNICYECKQGKSRKDIKKKNAEKARMKLKCKNEREFRLFSFMDDRKDSSIPSLSANISLSLSKQKRIYPNRFNGITQLYDVIPDSLNHHEKKYKDLVYYKGKKMRWFNEEIWQPHGRIEQPHDDIFDNINWRDMLKKRLIILEKAKKS